jgi:hypothetical protein
VNILAKGGGKMGGDGSGLNVAGLFASWELDLWGRVRSQRYAATAQHEAAVLDLAYARNFNRGNGGQELVPCPREATAQRAIATEMVQSSAGPRRACEGPPAHRQGRRVRRSCRPTRACCRIVTPRCRPTARAAKPCARSKSWRAGIPGADVDAGMDLPRPPPIPVGLPPQILERRAPDVRAGERRRRAAYYNVAEARAARLPRIALTASVKHRVERASFS